MKVNGKNQRTIWMKREGVVQIIDQRSLPHQLVIEDLTTVDETVTAIRDMHVRGAPLIGVTAAFGVYLAVLGKENLELAAGKLKAARPTAVNLNWAVDKMMAALKTEASACAALALAEEIAEQEVENCRKIGEHGMSLIKEAAKKKPGIGEKGQPVNILTHCNAGWLACVDYGTAIAPIYAAFDEGVPVHVWVDETRPRSQGGLTAWELGHHGVPHTVIVDNTGGHLMQHGMVDICIVGTDRTTRRGDVANKIGTYLKALAAKDNNIPFYVALPATTFDLQLADGLAEIPIEERDPAEVKYIYGKTASGGPAPGGCRTVGIYPDGSPARNFAFDVTPARLVSALITERGICSPNEESITALMSDAGG